jgi:hypothetical protein
MRRPGRFMKGSSHLCPLSAMMHHKKVCKVGILAAILGIVITWFTGFFTPLFPQMTVDVLQWGSPFPYLHRVVTFAGPAFVDWTMAFVDFVIWTIIVFLILYFGWASRGTRKKKKR